MASDTLPAEPIAPAATAAPAAGRYGVLALVCVLSMITYLDRVCFGVAASSLAAELGLPGVAGLKWAFTAFTIAYALFEIPAGWMGDRLGPRGTLVRIVIWWSVCTALTGLVGLRVGGYVLGGLGTLVLLRFLFGAGEAGAYPNITRALHNWFPSHQWEFAQGFVWMSGRLMGGITPLIWALLVTGTSVTAPLVNWRGAFLIFGVTGLVWCLAFRAFFRNHPPGREPEPGSIRAESHAIPWRWMLTNGHLIALCLVYSLLNYGWAFNITYLPSYLEQRFGLPPTDELGAIYRGAPLWVGAIGCLSGGYCVSLIDRRVRNRRLSRRILGTVAMLCCAACWGVARQTESVHAFCVSVALAAFFVDLTLGATWATCQDIGGRHTAVVAAAMNTIGTLGAAAANWLTGTIVEQALNARAAALHIPVATLPPTDLDTATTGGYATVFATYAAMYVLAALAWQFTGTRATSAPAR